MLQLKPLILSQALRQKRLNGARHCDPRLFQGSDAGTCKRCIFFKCQGRPNEEQYDSKANEARIKMLLDDGRLHQHSVSEYIKEAPGVHLTNIEGERLLFVDDFAIMCHVDGIIHDVKENKRYVLEVKGLSRYNNINDSRKGESDGDLGRLREGYPGLIPQARVYSKSFDTDGAIAIVKDKDTSNIHEFFIDRDPEKEERIIDKYRCVRKALVDGIPPPCDHMKGDSRTKYCHYPTECGHGK